MFDLFVQTIVSGNTAGGSFKGKRSSMGVVALVACALLSAIRDFVYMIASSFASALTHAPHQAWDCLQTVGPLLPTKLPGHFCPQNSSGHFCLQTFGPLLPTKLPTMATFSDETLGPLKPLLPTPLTTIARSGQQNCANNLVFSMMHSAPKRLA